MQVEAIYEQGRLEFTRPLQFKNDRVRLLIDVPDEALVDSRNPYQLPPDVLALAAQMRHRMDQIRHAPLPPDDQLPPVSVKTLERIEAFTLREDH